MFRFRMPRIRLKHPLTSFLFLGFENRCKSAPAERQGRIYVKQDPSSVWALCNNC
jgi:hypothetical protein